MANCCYPITEVNIEQEQLIAKLREENEERNEDYKACTAHNDLQSFTK